MLVSKFLLGLSCAISWVAACTEPDPNNPLDDLFQIGEDGPAPLETLGYFINHVGLLPTNLAPLKHFYHDILGMRLIFDVQLTPEFTITYLGHGQGGRNGTGFQTGEEFNREKNNLAGLLEIVTFNVSDDTLLGSVNSTNTFDHIGLVVPDIVVEVLKPYGEAIEMFTGPVNNAFGIDEYAGVHAAAKQRLMEAQGIIGLPLLLMIADPDGNLVEVQQQEQPAGVL
ncbi:VOC family protein [Aspergillus undulatus]|uniref:VOC family protein n=1 Tax=Aspergillus undulatus TaxID=1810928 RepID=UPI003CCD5DE4